MSSKQPQAVREALDVEELMAGLEDWLKAYVRDHPDVSIASIQMALRVMAGDFAVYGILSSPPPKDKKA